MKALEHPDSLHLKAAIGWLELGNHLEANEELERISPQLRAHPCVLEVRWHIYAKESKWNACVDIARTITELVPSRPDGWIHRAYSLRRADWGGIESAKKVLLGVVDTFPQISIIPYNLACYDCQLGDLKAARSWLERAFKIDETAELKQMALSDADLEPLWREIGNL